MRSTRTASTDKDESGNDRTGSTGKGWSLHSEVWNRMMGLYLGAPGLSPRFAIGLFPALLALVITVFTDFSPVNPGAKAFLWWTPGEFGIWAALAGAGVAWSIYREMRSAHIQLSEVREAEDKRRVIAAIGVAASWDLDLERLYQRVSQDLRSILNFDRFTITGALPTGRMRVEFVSGDSDDGPVTGETLPEAPDEPDGVYAEHRSKYGSRLTAAVPACNGALTIRSRAAEQYTPRHLDLLRQAVAQISPGIANAILFQSSERRLRERTALADIGRAATSVLDQRKVIAAVDMSLADLAKYDHLGVVLLNEGDGEHATGDLIYWSQPGLYGHSAGDRIHFDADGISPSDVVLSSGPVLPAITTAKVSPDSDSRVWLQAPLVVQEKLIGILILSSDDPNSFGEEESALLLNVSLQVAPAIQNANLTASLKRQAEERRTVAAIGLAANDELRLEAIYMGVADELEKILQYDRLSITYEAPDGDGQEIAYTRGLNVEGYGVGDTVREIDSRSLNDPSGNRDWSSMSPTMRPLKEMGNLRSRTSAPLGKEPNILGMLHVGSTHENAYDAQAAELLEQIAIQITPAIRNARMIAAERELRETLDRQNQKLYEANNARKQFLSTVSHELKTPLTIISGFIDLLGAPDDGQNEEERQDTLSIIRRNADQLDVLINDILDISRLDAGTFKINPAPFSVNELVSDLEASFQSLLRTKTQTLGVEMAEDELWINADRARISQVITNLLSNASKYSADNTQILLGCGIDGERLHITVTDHGVGMSEEEQKGLFTAFFRVDNETTRKVPGTGLGLVIAKSITELHGGEIRLKSQPGEGTTIELWLPELTTKEASETEQPEQAAFAGSRLWPDGPPEDIGLGAA